MFNVLIRLLPILAFLSASGCAQFSGTVSYSADGSFSGTWQTVYNMTTSEAEIIIQPVLESITAPVLDPTNNNKPIFDAMGKLVERVIGIKVLAYSLSFRRRTDVNVQAIDAVGNIVGKAVQGGVQGAGKVFVPIP